MEAQNNLFDPIPLEKFDLLSREDLMLYVRGMQGLVTQLQSRNQELATAIEEAKTQVLLVDAELVRIRSELYGKSSEKLPPLETTTGEDLDASTRGSDSSPKTRKTRIQLPSKRYPNAPLIEREVTLVEIPDCGACGEKLEDSGLTESVEYLEKVPASYQVIRELKHKYNCTKCHGDLRTSPALPRIKPGSAFGDSVVIDVAVSKYCDLIPIGRQVKIAERLGLPGLPPQSLIETSHYLANFLRPVYEKLRVETISSRVLYADETPHRMLEGSEKSGWYFWGFSGENSAYFEAHGTRSGDISIEFLKNSTAEYLMSDVYSGYVRTETVVNADRDKKKLPRLIKIYCNAHARRKFMEARVFSEESEFFLLRYQRIYRLEALGRERGVTVLRENRLKMMEIFSELRTEALERLPCYSEKSAIVRAYRYFLKNFAELTEFTKDVIAPMDNNAQERLLRNPVIGRKTWYGTHSIRGAETAAILFSVMESCKLNGINPRGYLSEITALMHQKKDPPTPGEFKEASSLLSSSTPMSAHLLSTG